MVPAQDSGELLIIADWHHDMSVEPRLAPVVVVKRHMADCVGITVAVEKEREPSIRSPALRTLGLPNIPLWLG